LFFVFLFYRSKRYYSIALILVLCTNTYAIPDAVLRLTPDIYPSIYTKYIFFSIKAIDILVVVTFFSSILSFPSFINIRGVNILFIVLFLTSISTLFSVFYGVVDWGYLLFYLRGAILAIGIFCLVSQFKKEEIVQLLYFSMFCWICKMMFMIAFPSGNVIQREILGFAWKIFFAGDEYLYFGFMTFCIVSLVRFDSDAKKHYIKCFKYCFVALVLAIIAQRKGAVPYFIIVYGILYCSYKGGLFLRIVSNSVLIVYASLFFLFFVFIYPIIPDVYKLAFSEYHVLYVSAVDSLIHLFDNNVYGSILGLGSMGLYEIFSLPGYADHSFSFGSEVGNIYRYAIWNLPFGRLSVNSGLLGLFLVLVFLLSKISKEPSVFYILFSVIPFFGMYGVTPISGMYIGFGLAVLYRLSFCKKSRGGDF
jgi:hypothetical protein